ncbi:MAG: V-type ATP synthase subunit F [Oscillospiraceae bacterium]|nr:V-type ATP synthase subunit F [Oscillospiraceae bacterium]
MKFYVICDKVDVLLGMRIAGIEGQLIVDEKEAAPTLERISQNEEIAVVLITERLAELCREKVYDIKLNRMRPLIVEIPNRDGSGGGMGAISRYVEEAIGIKL